MILMGRTDLINLIIFRCFFRKIPTSSTVVATTFMKSYAYFFDKKVKCDHKGNQLKWVCTGIGQSSNGTKAPCKWQVIGYKKKMMVKMNVANLEYQ